MGNALVIDAGSSSVRARLVGDDGRVIAGASRLYAYANEADGGELARAFDLRGCWGAIVGAVNEALAGGDAPSSVAVTSQRQALVFLDDAGRALYAGPNTDLRAVFQGAALDDEHGNTIYRTTGHRPAFMMATGKLAWLRDARPDDYARVSHILTLADWIAWRLTGEIASEPSLAAASGLVDIRTRRWASSLFAEIGLRLPETPLRDASEVARRGTERRHSNAHGIARQSRRRGYAVRPNRHGHRRGRERGASGRCGGMERDGSDDDGASRRVGGDEDLDGAVSIVRLGGGLVDAGKRRGRRRQRLALAGGNAVRRCFPQRLCGDGRAGGVRPARGGWGERQFGSLGYGRILARNETGRHRVSGAYDAGSAYPRANMPRGAGVVRLRHPRQSWSRRSGSWASRRRESRWAAA